jgi:hypothetical protein
MRSPTENSPPASQNTTPEDPTPDNSAPEQPTHNHPRHRKPPKIHLKFYNFNQNVFRPNGKYEWGGKLAHAGCLPTSWAMIASTETQHTHKPTETRRVLKNAGDYNDTVGGTIYGGGPSVETMKDKYHLNGHKMNFQQLKAVIKERAAVGLIHAKRGHFTGGGHFMVIKSFIGGRFHLADPNEKPGRDSERREGWTAHQLRQAGIDRVYGVWNSKFLKRLRNQTNSAYVN